MTWIEFVIIAWICAACGVEVAVRDSDLPGSSAIIDSESHTCPHCGTLRDGR